MDIFVRGGVGTVARIAAVLMLAFWAGLASAPVAARPTAIVGATLIDGTGRQPVARSAVVLDGDRILYAGPARGAPIPNDALRIDATGGYLIPGLMDANVHLFSGIMPDRMKAHEGRFAELVLEAAQITLKAGITTVFDTWGPREGLVTARDRIASGAAPGSRILVAGNIIGMDGPATKLGGAFPGTLTPEEMKRFDAMWEQGVGADLLWRTPAQVGETVRAYIATGQLDILKYLSNDHDLMHLIAFSPDAQRAIIAEGHRAGLNVQAHTTSPEGLKLAIEAGADLLQHCDISGFEPIPAETIALIAQRRLPCAAMFHTSRRLAWEQQNMPELLKVVTRVQDQNDRAPIKAGALLLLATDGGVPPPVDPKLAADPRFAQMQGPDNSSEIPRAHILWLIAAREKGMAPMDALMAATRNIAIGYGRAKDLGTVEAGKLADLVLLDSDPLADPENYARIRAVWKAGVAVDRAALPQKPILTAPAN
jgi:imidazolonepropionase-like amidohydrolase